MLDCINIFISDIFKSLIHGDVDKMAFFNLVMLINSIQWGDLNTCSTDSSVESTEIGTMTADEEGEGQNLTSECIWIFAFNMLMCWGACFILLTCLGARLILVMCLGAHFYWWCVWITQKLIAIFEALFGSDVLGNLFYFGKVFGSAFDFGDVFWSAFFIGDVDGLHKNQLLSLKH